jgi:hypothetical protein
MYHEARKKFKGVVRYSLPEQREDGTWRTVYLFAYPEPIMTSVEELAAQLERKINESTQATGDV